MDSASEDSTRATLLLGPIRRFPGVCVGSALPLAGGGLSARRLRAPGLPESREMVLSGDDDRWDLLMPLPRNDLEAPLLLLPLRPLPV